MKAIIVASAGELCWVTLARVDHHRQAAENIETLGVFPEPLAWQIAARIAQDRGLPVAGPHGVADTIRT
jgi:hypothetical protein